MTMTKVEMRQLMEQIEKLEDIDLELLGTWIVEIRRSRLRRQGLEIASMLEPGKSCRIRHSGIKPKYLGGQPVTIEELNGDKALVTLDRGPQGKFRNGRVWVPFSLLEMI